MAGIRDIAEGRSDVLKIDPRKLKIKEGWNSRDMSDPANIEHIEELSLSIAEVGVKRPLVVNWENGEAFVTDGECRWRATIRAIEVHKADIKTVPVITEDKYSNEADRIFSQIIQNSGKPLTIFEQSKVYKKLLDMGWSQKDIASKSGKTASRVSQILELQTMPEEVKAMVTSGAVSPTLALQTVKAEGSKAASVLSDAVETAKAEGKEQAMPKHMGEKPVKVNIAKTLKEIFETAAANGLVDDSENMVTISITEADYETIRNLLKL